MSGSWEIGGVRIVRAEDSRPTEVERRVPPKLPRNRGAGVFVPMELIEGPIEGLSDDELERMRREAEASPDRGPGVYIPHHLFTPETRKNGAVRIARSLGITRAPAVVAHGGERAAAASAYSDELTSHNYDGIQEYDNPIPGWWHMLMWGSVVFSLCYVLVYHSPLVPTLHDRHASAEARALGLRFAELREIPMGEGKLLAIMAEESWLDQGASLFQMHCALCHQSDGSGSIGVNLTDEHYKNTTSLLGIVDVIENGAANQSMPAQKNILRESEIALVAAYAASLRGKDLEGKEPEGEIIPPWPTLDADGNVVPAGSVVEDPGDG